MGIILLVILISSIALGNDYNTITKIQYEVNRVWYVSDMDNYGVENYIATPEEFYKNGGDCEDYVIAKHQRLRDAGFDDERISYIWALYGEQMHVMLKVDDYVLDSQTRLVRDMDYVNSVYKNPMVISYRIVKLMKGWKL